MYLGFIIYWESTSSYWCRDNGSQAIDWGNSYIRWLIKKQKQKSFGLISSLRNARLEEVKYDSLQQVFSEPVISY